MHRQLTHHDELGTDTAAALLYACCMNCNERCLLIAYELNMHCTCTHCRANKQLHITCKGALHAVYTKTQTPRPSQAIKNLSGVSDANGESSLLSAALARACSDSVLCTIYQNIAPWACAEACCCRMLQLQSCWKHATSCTWALVALFSDASYC
jgi:hypothetical protein